MGYPNELKEKMAEEGRRLRLLTEGAEAAQPKPEPEQVAEPEATEPTES